MRSRWTLAGLASLAASILMLLATLVVTDLSAESATQLRFQQRQLDELLGELCRSVKRRVERHAVAVLPRLPGDHLPGSIQRPDIDVVVWADQDGQMLRAAIHGEELELPSYRLAAKGVGALLANVPATPGATVSGFVLTAEGPAVAAAARRNHEGETALLMLGSLLDHRLLDEIGHRLQLPHLHFSPGPATAPGHFELLAQNGTFLGTLVWGPLPDEAGTLVAKNLWLLAFLLAGAALLLPTLGRHRSETAWIEKDLRHALRTGSLHLHYQPQIDLRTGRIVGAEALVRWTHPVHGALAPDVFIPVAERAGLIDELGRLVLRRAAEEAAHWGGIRVAVNVSPLQFRQPGLVEQVRATLATTGLQAGRLELEITETAVFDNPARALVKMHWLRSLGVRLALDDFGTGHSGLDQLHRFPFDKIKIDRSFTGRLEEHASTRTVVAAVVRLAHDLEIHLCAEGIETAAQRTLLTAMSCHEGQGFLFARPMPAEALCRMIAAQAASDPESCPPPSAAASTQPADRTPRRYWPKGPFGR